MGAESHREQKNMAPPTERRTYRVGCWDGSVEDGTATITHDSIEDEITVDVEELHDISNLIQVLLNKDSIERGTGGDVEQFEKLVRDLEA